MKISLQIIAFATALLTYSCSYSQDKNCKKSFLVAQYNVENLFDTIDDPHKNDNEFLPTGKKEWTSERYWDKQAKIAKVISSIDPKYLPDLVSLVEIEDKNVLEDLVKQESLSKINYQIVHNESPDARGIDCALLYNPKTMKLISTAFYKVQMEDNKHFKTREILYAKGETKSKDELHIFVNHWPSRRGGEEKSAVKRNLAASVLRHAIDSIFTIDSQAKIIILGDFNDETDNESIKTILGATADKNRKEPYLYDMATLQDQNNEGSYYYWKTKEWNMIDQMIISNSLLNATKGLQAKEENMNIFKPDWILHKEKDGTMAPSKTYGGSYYGGYSDHLAVYQFFYYKCK